MPGGGSGGVDGGIVGGAAGGPNSRILTLPAFREACSLAMSGAGMGPATVVAFWGSTRVRDLDVLPLWAAAPMPMLNRKIAMAGTRIGEGASFWVPSRTEIAGFWG